MERLTIEKCGSILVKDLSGGYQSPCFGCESIGNCTSNRIGRCATYRALEKLKDYEDLEAQGKLMKLPCEVGSEVWYIDAYEGKHSAKIVRGTVDGYSWFRSCGFALNVLFDEPIMGHFAYKRKEMPLIEIGKTIFLLKPEAEVALQKMNETEGTE